MANVRRLGDYQNLPAGNYQQGQALNMPFLSRSPHDPRKDNFLSMLKNSLCPKLELLSFTTVICILITTLYITMLTMDGIQNIDNPTAFLYVKFQAMKDFGGNSAFSVKYNGLLYYWLTSTVLIPNFYALVMAIVLILILYSPIESTQGLKTTIVIYIGGGIGGAIFGDACNCCSLVPYSEVYSSVYAALGCYLGMVIIYWSKLDLLGPLKCYFMCMFGMILFMVLLFSFTAEQLYIDNMGKFGGFLTGTFISMSIINVPQAGNYETKCKYIGMGFLAFFIVLNIILLYSLSY